MDSLCTDIKGKLKPVKNDQIEIEYVDDKRNKRQFVNVYITDDKEKNWYFGIEKEEGGNTGFEIVFSPRMSKKEVDENKEEIYFYYKTIRKVFEIWIKKQRDFRFQYLLHPDSIVTENITICYVKSLKKDLT